MYLYIYRYILRFDRFNFEHHKKKKNYLFFGPVNSIYICMYIIGIAADYITYTGSQI